MAVLDDDFSVDGTLAEGGGIWSPPEPTPAGVSHDYRALYERERARAEAAEARCEELRWAEVSARSDAGAWKSRFQACRSKLDAAVEETKTLRREVRAGAPGLHREVARLRKELSRALAEPSAATTRIREDRLAALEAENLQLRKTLHREEDHRETIRRQHGEIVRHVAELRRLRDQAETVRSLSAELDRGHLTLEASKHERGKLTARLAKFRALGATLSRLPFDEAAHLRNVLRRSRRQKTTITRLRKENARLHKAVRGTRGRIETLETQLDKLRAAGSVLSKRLYGRRSEQQDKPRSQHKRGQQRGAPGHGRTRRPGIEERPEEINPPPDACVCGQCGQPYAGRRGARSTSRRGSGACRHRG